MAQLTADTNKNSLIATWVPWIAMALIATIAGLLLPQMMPADNALRTPSAKADAKDNKKLDYTAPSVPEAPNFQAMLLRLGGGTVVVLGLCVSTLWGIRRWVHPLPTSNGTVREMKLKETLNLGNRCALHLVNLGNREVLVGVDGAGIKVIVPLANAFDEVLAQSESPPPLSPPWQGGEGGDADTNPLPRLAT